MIFYFIVRFLKRYSIYPLIPMKYILFIAASISLCLPAAAQTGNGDLQMKKKFDGPRFYSENRLLKPKEVLTYMQSNDEAYTTFKKAKANYDAAQVFGFIGGALIGYPIGTAIGGGDPQWGLAVGGVGMVLLSIPFTHAFSKHATHAFDLYNQSNATARTFKPKLYVGSISNYGMGVTLKF